ncbi:hypothetical protein ASF34_20825 [Methylobacterium sp. Leaf106]|uniref:HTH-type transcriptional regulator YbaQ n=1 Tax=Methylobacterium bullatum TaxID=570505 RepID=A0A679KBM3_9HYPH|nr:hypothetical protein ASF34_20825 [Methylobacterium sp. Leaf106]CAA2145544.1 hypothetical protein MBLL_04670 [Methylobacterium bullatum]
MKAWPAPGARHQATGRGARSRIERIVKEEIGISTDTALRLARYFGTSHQFWLNLQADFESDTLLSEIGLELDRIEPLPAVAA